MYDVTRTTISRIKKGENHCEIRDEYLNLPLEERKNIYNIFCESTNFYADKVNTTIIQSKRKLTEEQVHLILLNEELKKVPKVDLMKRFGIKSNNTFLCIIKGQSYKDFSLSYSKLTDVQKEQLASLLRN